jgi:hypothetical protein
MPTSRRQDGAGEKAQEENMAVEGIGRDNVVPIETLRRLHAERVQAEASSRRPSPVNGADENAAAARDAEEARRAAEARPRSAEEQARLVDRFKSETADLPEVRRDKVIEAKLRISTGYYNRDDVRREVLRSVLTNLLPSSPTVQKADEATSTTGTPAPEGGPAPESPNDE